MIVFLIIFPQFAYPASYPSLDMSMPTFENMQDKTIREAKAGQQIMIIGSVRNDIYLDENKSLTLLVEVRDQDDVTIYLAWQSGRVSPNDTFSFGTSWTVPSDAVIGTVYETRTFALTFIGNEAEPLSTVLSNQITISPAVPTPKVTQLQALEIVGADLKAHDSEPITEIMAYEGRDNFVDGMYLPISTFKEGAGSNVSLRLVYSNPDKIDSPILLSVNGDRSSLSIDCSESPDALVCILSCFSKGELFWIVDIFSEYYAVDAITGEILFSQSRQEQIDNDPESATCYN